MKPGTLFLIRHGFVGEDASARFLGRTDVPLSEEGYQQARQITLKLSETRGLQVWTSPLLRAIETARTAFPHAEITPVPLAAEFSFGCIDGMTPSEAAQLFPEGLLHFQRHILDARPLGGENWDDLLMRASEVARMMNEINCLVLVSHRYFISALVACLRSYRNPVLLDIGYSQVLSCNTSQGQDVWCLNDLSI